MSVAPRVLAPTTLAKNTYQSMFESASQLQRLPECLCATYLGEASMPWFTPGNRLANQVIKFGDVTYIWNDQYAFASDYFIKDFTACSQVPTLNGSNANIGLGGQRSIIVPDSLYNDWIAAQNWNTASISSCIVRESDYYV